MEDYRLTQSGQEVQDILNGAAMQSDLIAETERATGAEQTLQGNIDAEATRAQGAEGTLQDNIDAEETRAKAAEKQNADDIDAIDEKIPSGASSSNKLATEEYVSDAVTTATATFRGTYNLVSDLHLNVTATEQQIAAALAGAISTADNNDYCFILVPTSSETPTEIKEIDRYKFNGTAWAFEYKLNNSGFTAAQWAAINSGITSGDVAKLAALPTNAQLTTLLAGLQSDIDGEEARAKAAELAIQGNIEAEETRAKTAEKQNADDIDAIEAVLPESASSENKVATESEINSLSAAIEAILLLIPSAATSLNKLADKAFVNSSIATATATFRGTYNLVDDLGLTTSATHAQIATALAGAILTADNNDYAFVQIPTSTTMPTEIAKTERYKFNGTAWEYEYDLNNSGFTADQWAAINSGITQALVTKLSDLPTNAQLTTELGTLTSGITTINQKIPNAASQANKLVDTAAMESYIVEVLNVLTISYNVTSTDGHVTFHIEQVDGKITSVTLTTSDIASAAVLDLKASQADLTALASRVTTAEGNITTLGGRVSTNETDIAQLQAAYEALTQSDIIIGALPASGVANKIYRVPGTSSYSDYMWNGTQFVLMATYNNAIDPRPKKASQNLVTSGGVFDNMGALDVSELNATENPHTLAKYVDLSAALAAIPTDYQKGGMSIKFVRTSDNKYVQCRYLLDDAATNSKFTNVANWQSDSQSNFPYIDFSGKGSTALISPSLSLIEGHNYRAWILDKNISDSSIPDDYAVLSIQKEVNNSFVDIFSVTKQQGLEDYYDFALEGSAKIRVFGRCDSGYTQRVYFEDTTIAKELMTDVDSLKYETKLIGKNSTIVSSSPIYGLVPNRSYKIQFSNINWNLDTGTLNALIIENVYNNASTSILEITIDKLTLLEYVFSIPSNSDYIIVKLRAKTDVIVGFRFMLLDDVFHSISVIGKGNTLVTSFSYSNLVNGKYRVILPNTSPDVTGVSSSNTIFAVKAAKEDGSDAISISPEIWARDVSTLKRYYDVILPEGYSKIYFVGRYVFGYPFSIYLMPIDVPISEDKEINYTKGSITISNYSNESMCQCPAACYDSNSGYLFVAYYTSNAIKRESLRNNTVKARLAKVPVSNFSKGEFIDIMECGQSVGDYTQNSNISPYDPNVVLNNGELYYLFVGCKSNNSIQGYYCRKVNPNTLALDNVVSPLTFSYQYNGETITIGLESSTDMNLFIDRMMGREEGTSRNGDYPILSNIVYYNGLYYSYMAGVSGSGKGYTGCIVKSNNLINWELESCPSQLTSLVDVWEAAIDIKGSVMYIMYRNNNCPRVTYNISDSTWGTLNNTLTTYEKSRNFVYVKGDYIFGFANTTLSNATPVGNVIRTAMKVFKFDSSFNIIQEKIIKNDFGLVYPVVIRASAGEYLICAANKRWEYGSSPLPNYPSSEIDAILINGIMD